MSEETSKPKETIGLQHVLSTLCAIFGHAADPEEITAGFPLENGKLSLNHIDEAAANIGIALTYFEGDTKTLTTAMMPAILVRKDGDIAIVLAIKNNKCETITPGVKGKLWLDFEAVFNDSIDRCILARPVFHLDTRSLLYFKEQPKRWFWDTILSNRRLYQWGLLASLMLNLVGALIPFYTMAVYDRVVPTNSTSSLWVLTVAVLIAMLFELGFKMIRSYLLEVAGKRIDLTLSSFIFSHALKLRAQSRPASGGVLANTVRDFESVRDFFTSATLTVLGDLPFTLIYLLMIVLIGGWLACIPVLVMLLAITLTFIVEKPINQITKRSMQASSQRTAHLFEVINGIDVVKALGVEAWARRKWETLCLAISQDNLRMREWTSLGNYGAASLFALDTVLIVMVGALLIADHQLTMGQLIASSMLAGRALGPIGQLNSMLMRWEQTRQSLEGVERIMTAKTDESEGQIHVNHIRGEIKIEDLEFSYSDKLRTLKKLNLNINPGEKIGMIGRLGSGKSTLLRLLLNQYQAQQGTIRIDGISISDMHPMSLRRLIGYMPQDVMLFHGTVKDNILLGRTDITTEQFTEAIQIAGLSEVLTQLDNGLNTEVGERGERLSGGQRQSVALARCLVHKPKLILLDEPTSMMDPSSEQFVLANLRKHLKDSTIILVTHRMAMLPMVERLLVFDHGQIILDGPRDVILNRLARGASMKEPPSPPPKEEPKK